MVVLPDPPLGVRTTMRCMRTLFCHIRVVTRFAAKPTHPPPRRPGKPIRSIRDCEREHAAAHRGSVESAPMEFFLYLWDELDDVAGACRHVATSTALEIATAAAPLIAAASEG